MVASLFEPEAVFDPTGCSDSTDSESHTGIASAFGLMLV